MASGVIVAAGTLVATARLLARRAHNAGNYYSSYRQDIGRAILLGLEFLIAGDIIRTVVVAPTIQNVVVLGLIVLIRTFLSLSLNWKSKEDCLGGAKDYPRLTINVANASFSLSGSRGDNRDRNQRQQSPRTAARLSLIRNGTSARAATLSSHHQPSNQVAAKPTIKTMER